MYLASGVAKIKEMLDRGITVALASDGPGSNNRQDMFETCKATVLLQKVHNLDAGVLQPEEVLHLACRHGAKLVGKEKEIGSLEVGKKADLIVVDLMTAFAAPVHRVASAIVYCATPRDVVHVMVDGKLLIRNKEITFTNEKEAIARATEYAEKIFQKAGIATRLL